MICWISPSLALIHSWKSTENFKKLMPLFVWLSISLMQSESLDIDTGCFILLGATTTHTSIYPGAKAHLSRISCLLIFFNHILIRLKMLNVLSIPPPLSFSLFLENFYEKCYANWLTFALNEKIFNENERSHKSILLRYNGEIRLNNFKQCNYLCCSMKSNRNI